MKPLFRLLLLSMISSTSSKLHSQPPPAIDSTPVKCRWDLRSPIYVDSNIRVTDTIYYGRPYVKPIPRYKDVSYDMEEDCTFPVDDCITNDSEALKYRVYYPLHNYGAIKLPAFIFIHGGGLSDCSSFNDLQLDTVCREFAKRGFVTFNCEYRRGRIIDVSHFNLKTVQQQLASYRGAQDARGVIRSIIKRERYHNDSFPSDPYRIDTTLIFLGGNSAGALLAISAAYYRNQTMFDTVYPSLTGTPKIKNVLGSINSNFYYGDSTIQYLPLIKGVLSMWGGVPLPLTYIAKQDSFFYSTNSNYNPAFIGFQGYRDGVFPYDTIIPNVNNQRMYFHDPPIHVGDVDYNSESRCLLTGTGPYSLDTDPGTPDLINGSSINLYKIIKSFGKATEYYLDCQMKHGLDKQDGVNFHSDFGTGYTTSHDVYNYIVQRSTTFFQAVINGATYSNFTYTKFTECENFRHNCQHDSSTTNDSCQNEDSCQ